MLLTLLSNNFTPQELAGSFAPVLNQVYDGLDSHTLYSGRRTIPFFLLARHCAIPRIMTGILFHFVSQDSWNSDFDSAYLFSIGLYF